MKSIVFAMGAMTGLLGATAASAEQLPGLYIAADTGYHWKSDQKVTSDNTVGASDQKFVYNLSTKDQASADFHVGWRYDDHLRAEIELGYAPGKVNAAMGPKTDFGIGKGAIDSSICSSMTPTVCSAPGGKIDQTTLFVNGIYDLYPEYSLHPYIGVGIGLDYVSGKVDGQLSQVSQPIALKTGKLAPAAQFILGVSSALTDNLSLDLGYRLSYVGDVKYDTTMGAGNYAPGSFKGHFNNQTLMVGLRYSFGKAPAVAAPPQAPVPQPASAPVATPVPPVPPAVQPAAAPQPVAPEARQFTVYFRFNRSSLTPDAQAVVHAAADYAVANHSTKVAVVGHTDTSGSAAYNIKLSQRRANATAKALVEDGVDKSILAVSWKGETDLAVSTADGVREPQNRRATIDVLFQ